MTSEQLFAVDGVQRRRRNRGLTLRPLRRRRAVVDVFCRTRAPLLRRDGRSLLVLLRRLFRRTQAFALGFSFRFFFFTFGRRTETRTATRRFRLNPRDAVETLFCRF